MAKDSEIIGEFIVTIEDSGSVTVNRISKSTKEVLEKIWADGGMGEHPKTWNTQDLGRHILNDLCNGQKEATIGEYIIEREANNRINVLRTYSNTKKGLRECAETIGFDYHDNWDTRQLGRELIKFIKSKNS